MNNLNRTLIIIGLLLIGGIATTLQKPYEFLTRDINTAYLNYNFSDIYRTAQNKNFIIVTTTQSATDGTEGNIFVLNAPDGHSFICVKTDGSTWKKVEVK